MRSLYLRLSAVLLVLFTLLAAVFLLTLSRWSGTYLDEQSQKTQGMLAGYMAREHHAIGVDVLDVSSMATLFKFVAIVNPVAQAYLLDPNGRILAQSDAKADLLRKTVGLDPIHAYLNRSRPLPILGDDPRERQRQRIFSVAKLGTEDKVIGYVYVTLAGGNPLSLQELWMGSQNFKVASLLLIVCLAFAFLTGLLLFRFLTNRLHRLTRAVEDFKERQYTEEMQIPPYSKPGDEIDRLTEVFGDMGHRIIDQIRRLERIDHDRRTSITNASHDLRTPLTAMQGYLETLLIKHDRLDDAQRHRYIEIAHKHSVRLQTLVSEMFDLARLDSPDLATQREMFALDELVVDITQKFQLAADQKTVSLIASVPRESCFVLADVAMIERVFENLLGNALRHTAPHGKVEVILTKTAAGIQVQVNDNGEGIPADMLESVFERFVAGRQPAQPRSGLGLAIVKRIIELHGATVRLESEVDKGTSISFELALAGSA